MSDSKRQRSFRDKLHGIGLNWQNKKSESFPKEEKTSNTSDSKNFSIKNCSEERLLLSSSAPVGQTSLTFAMFSHNNSSNARNRTTNADNWSTVDISTNEKKTLSRSLTQPHGTIEYMASSTDTLSSIAARFETTPSELTKINRLTSRLIFPGQVMFVPKKCGVLTSSDRKELVTPPNSPNDKTSNESLELSPKPGHAKRIHSDSTGEGSLDESYSQSANISISPLHQHLQQSSSAPITSYQTYKSSKTSRTIDPADRECLERFLKINARHITDGQGVVGGVLLITPNALMFDPNVSDPLVIEHGAEHYGVTVPMEMVLKTALYSDIAHMRVKHAPEVLPSAPRPEVYYAREDQLEDDLLLKASCGHIIGSDLNQSSNSDTIQTEIETNETESDTTLLMDCNANVEQINSEDKKDLNESSNTESNKTQSTSSETNDESNCPKNDGIENVEERHESEEQKTSEVEQLLSEEKILENNESVVENNEKEMSGELEDQFKEDKDEKQVLKPEKNDFETEKLNEAQNLVQSKVTLGMRHSVPDTLRHDRKSTSTLVTAISAEESVSVDKRRSAQGETRREQMLKRLSNPVDTIGNLTKSGISSGINATKTGISTGISATKTGINKVLATPKNIVEFSSGLVRDAKDALTTNSGSKTDSLEADLEIFSKGTTNSNYKKLHSIQTSDNRQTSIGYQNMVDNKIDVFANFENLGFHFKEFELIPRPAQSCEDPPLYLCLRMGRPINKKLQTYSPAIISFGKKKIEREYWFSIPKEKADNLYHFFNRWAPEIYGDVDDLNGCDERGLAAIDTDDELEDEETDEGTDGHNVDGKSDKSSEKSNRQKFWRRRGPLNFLKMVEGHFTADGLSPDWQVIPTDNSGGRRVFELTELPLPELIGASDILTEELRKKLSKHLPARAEGYSWTLIYSTSKHGFSLKTLYREMNKYETPVLLIIEDTLGTIFGALISCALRISDHFYGTGETFVFTFHPEFQCFPWTGENLFFVKGNADSISIGAGDGNFGLWLDGDLFHGRSHPCKTFGNSMLSLQEDFVVKALECWGFV